MRKGGKDVMNYYESEDLLIRPMQPGDAEKIVEAELRQGWHSKLSGYLKRLEDQRAGLSHALIAVYRGEVAGYVNVYLNSLWGAFGGKGLPEIVDFGVMEAYRKRGIGSKLMDTAEQIAARYADTVYLGVGLHSGYGSAQRMYARRGYIPDGSGVWYGDTVCEPYSTCTNDDELVLYLSKKLK